MARYLLQHLDISVGLHEQHPTTSTDSLDKAKARADMLWADAGRRVRQEIIDDETRESWWRADGEPAWHHRPARPSEDPKVAALYVVRNADEGRS